MFEKTLPENAKDSLAVLGKSNLLKNAYLAGGTALAMQIGHRISVDLDFFTPKKFDKRILAQKFTDIPINFKLDSLSEGTILGYLNETRFSLFFYKYPLLAKSDRFSGVNIAGIKDIAPMKLSAISDRGTKRDFVDLYFIIAVEKKFTLSEIFNLYDIKFKVLQQNKLHIMKSLVYFADAEEDPMPRMIKDVSWREIKIFFEKEVKNLTRKIL
jgi:hypothetical protein